MSHWYAIRPSDTFLIRDGRNFVTGDGSKYESTLPNPSTVGGAMGAAIGGRFGFLRGPYLGSRLANGKWILYLTLPRCIFSRSGGRPERYTVVPQQASPLNVATSSFVGAKLTTSPRNGHWEYNESLIPLVTLSKFLQGVPDDRIREAEKTLDDLIPVEHRIGIAREDGQTIDGFLYSAEHRRPNEGKHIAFLVETDKEPESIKNQAVPFGGAGRHASIEDAGDIEFPKVLPEYPAGRLLLYVATPGIWRSGSTPPLPDDVQVVAACIGSPQPIAIGGSYQNWKQKLSTSFFWAVPAGSVYFLQFNSDEAAHDWATKHHGKALVAGDSKKEKDRASTGFGVVFTGVWSAQDHD